jgi:hypothetical protein
VSTRTISAANHMILQSDYRYEFVIITVYIGTLCIRDSMASSASAAARIGGVEASIALFRELASIPVVKTASFVGNAVQIETTQREMDQDVSRRFVSVFAPTSASVDAPYRKVTPFPAEMRDAASRLFASPSGRYCVWIRKADAKPPASKPSFFLEIQSDGQMLYSVDTSSAHDKIYTDGTRHPCPYALRLIALRAAI